MGGGRTAWVFVALALLPATGRTVPPDRVFRMTQGDGQFGKIPLGGWLATSSDPGVVRVRTFDTSEVFLEAVSPGTALVLITSWELSQAKFWRVEVVPGQVTPEAPRPDPSALHRPCGCGHKRTYPIECRVKDRACLEALRGFLHGSELTVQDIRLQYTVEAAQALLADLGRRLHQAGFREVKLAFLGANLRISGRVSDREARRRLLMILYRGMLGKLIIEDRLDLSPPGRD